MQYRDVFTAGSLWVESVGGIIVARLRGEPTIELLRACHEQVLQLVHDTRQTKVLYDTLEMVSPPVDVPLAQNKLDEELGSIVLRRAIVVPNTRLGYLARLAFGEGDYRVFYNDLTTAIEWLTEN